MAVQFKNVSFSYNGEEKMLKNISLAIKNGVSIGIAGASGCGKSTFIHLLVRLLHDYAGSIELFGENLNDVSREEIAKRIAYVPQSPYVFSGTVKDNLLYGISRAVSDKELKEAAQKAQLYDELKDSLGGFSGKVAENGNNLSGGQRQRIALTRVFLSEADLIIFDEATSALDNTNEAVILERIEKEFKGKTMIMIAHRLTTLKNCDRIVVFDEGKIAQEGTYSVLAKTKGLFKNFLEQRATEKI
jgi:ABC-type multidrug transport system fused ATPase/permease subunit